MSRHTLTGCGGNLIVTPITEGPWSGGHRTTCDKCTFSATQSAIFSWEDSDGKNSIALETAAHSIE